MEGNSDGTKEEIREAGVIERIPGFCFGCGRLMKPKFSPGVELNLVQTFIRRRWREPILLILRSDDI